MDSLVNLADGFAAALTPQNLLLALIGVTIGTLDPIRDAVQRLPRLRRVGRDRSVFVRASGHRCHSADRRSASRAKVAAPAASPSRKVTSMIAKA